MTTQLAGRTIAQLFCLALGVGVVTSGLLGVTLVLETDGWHDAVHLVTGVALAGVALSRRGAPRALVAFGAFYAAVALTGFVDGREMLGLIAINPVDNVLHAGLAVAALAAGALRIGGR
ncbi:MAG: DUF4383 domain-containing protein [Solirubrobacteraceae bacterium MAG38_C4-C5]|nr:DUF4383 domain-containing protein [Candidatus Siliceabacter maunaloa]